jgi:RNA recognition motif-containing protein
MLRLFVGNLPPEAKERDVRALFEAYGTVRSIDIAHDIFSGKCKGFGFVEMEGHEARAAQAALDGKPMEGGAGFLKVRMENPRRGGRGRR